MALEKRESSLRISVLIPTFNSSATIGMTLESVFRQTLHPDEIFVLDDGSTDNTVAILNSYGPQITVLERRNRGVASARNELCSLATGDLIAFLDHDDLWNPGYLEFQRNQVRHHSDAVGYFTGHVDFHGYGNYEWEESPLDNSSGPEVITPINFLKALHRIPGTFVSPSFFCMPRRTLVRLGAEPFCEEVSGADDCYLYKCLVLVGPVFYSSVQLGAYRIIDSAGSTNKVEGCKRAVGACERVKERYRELAPPSLFSAFQTVFASERREYGKRLMGAGKVGEARRQFLLSIRDSRRAVSIAKSSALLSLTYLPRPLQPTWPPPERVVKISEGAQRA
jgi:glycosyltransferase involved in cell wall biosynthesis